MFLCLNVFSVTFCFVSFKYELCGEVQFCGMACYMLFCVLYARELGLLRNCSFVSNT